MEFTLTRLLDYPLPLAFLIYLTICTIILYTKPAFLFPASSHKNEEENEIEGSNKNLWLFFIILAVVIYVLISLLVSHVNRANYLALLSPKD